MLRMPAQLNSFHNCYGAGHDEREKDFCSKPTFSVAFHPCEGSCAGKGEPILFDIFGGCVCV